MDITCKKCGLVNDYRIIASGPHQTAYCNGCDKFIKHLPQDKLAMLYFGKYSGRLINSMQSPDEKQYLQWVLNNCTVSTKVSDAISAQLL